MVSRAGASLSKTLRTLNKPGLIITHRVEDWLVRNPDLVMTPEDVLLMQRLLGTARGSRVGVWTGSSAGKCERQQAFSFIGVPRLATYNPTLQNVFHDGTWRHLRWQMMLTKAIPTFQAELPTTDQTQRFMGAIDGADFDELWGFELKGTSNFTKVVGTGVFPEHLEQATRYWLSCDTDPNFPTLNKWVFLYEDKRSQEWREIVVQRDLATEKRVLQELRRLNKHADNKELPPVLPGCVTGSGQQFRWCPYSDKCRTLQTWQDAEAQVTGGSKSGGVASAPVKVTGTRVAGQRRKLARH